MRIVIALVLTVLWGVLGWFYVFQFVGWENFQSYNPDEVGQFLVGFSAPLFFLWMLAGYFQHGAELRNHSEALLEQGDELRRLVELAEYEARSAQANDFYLRRDSFLRFAELTTRDLNTIAVEIARDTASKDLMERTQGSFRAGNQDAFFALLIRSFVNQDIDKVVDFLKKSQDFPNNVVVYRRKYAKLLEEARESDTDGQMAAHFESASVGRLNEIFRDVEAVYGETPEPGDDRTNRHDADGARDPLDSGDA